MRPGRKTRLTPDVQEKIVNALSAGNYFEVACQYVGINPVMGHEWLSRGRGTHPTRPKTPLYAEFAEVVARVQAQDEVGTIARLKKAAAGGELLRETIIKDPDEITTFPDGRIVEKKGRSRTERQYTPPNHALDIWRMERKFTRRWGRQDRVDVHVFIEREVKRIQDDAELTEEEKTQLIREIEDYAYGRAEP